MHLVAEHELGLAGVAGAGAREQGVHFRRHERRQQHGLPVAPRRAVQVPLPHAGHVRAVEGLRDAVDAVEHCAEGVKSELTSVIAAVTPTMEMA